MDGGDAAGREEKPEEVSTSAHLFIVNTFYLLALKMIQPLPLLLSLGLLHCWFYNKRSLGQTDIY